MARSVAAAAGLYFTNAKPKPLFHAASEQDPLVKFAMQQRTLDRVKRLNGCVTQGEAWAPGCLRTNRKMACLSSFTSTAKDTNTPKRRRL